MKNEIGVISVWTVQKLYVNMGLYEMESIVANIGYVL